MCRANFLATLGLGSTAPNPLVGAVIVHGNRIIGEGFHRAYGGPHAEVHAIRSVANQDLLRTATLYVTMEPCAHQGKTPPCADLIIEKQIGRVVIGHQDPFEKVKGKGIEKLQQAGVDVAVGCLQEATEHVNRRFLIFHRQKRPYVLLKWAQTNDGFFARKNGDSKWISHEWSRQLVHKWRAEQMGIVVGAGTVLKDNPQLNIRDWTGTPPLPIILDNHGQIYGTQLIFETHQTSYVFGPKKQSKASMQYMESTGQPVDILNKLYDLGIQSVLVEGGSQVLHRFISSGCWDEARIFVSPTTFDEGIAAPEITGTKRTRTRVGTDELIVIWRNN